MKIKSIFALAAAIAVAATASAQLSINAGYQNQSHTQNLKIMSTETKSDTTMSGFFIGGTYNLQIAGGLGVAPGLYFSYAGSSDENTVLGTTTHQTMTDMNLKVPVLLNYGLDLNGDMKVFCFAGPVVNFGLTLEHKSWLNDDKDNAIKTNVYDTDPDDDDEDNLSRFDLGVSFGAGFHLRGLQSWPTRPFQQR